MDAAPALPAGCSADALGPPPSSAAGGPADPVVGRPPAPRAGCPADAAAPEPGSSPDEVAARCALPAAPVGGRGRAGAPCGAGEAAGWRTPSSGPWIVRRRSIRSMRWSSAPSPSSAAGSRMRATISSSSSRGAVVPRISISPLWTMSAPRDSVAGPSRCACEAMRSSWSVGPSMSPFVAASGTCWRTIRSRSRSSRSEANRRASCPASATRSIVPNAAAPSPAAIASHISSISAASVTPSSATAPA